MRIAGMRPSRGLCFWGALHCRCVREVLRAEQQETYRERAPLAAAMLNMGTTYMINRHSLCPRPLIRRIKTRVERRIERIRASTSAPMTERGAEANRSFGRYAVK